MFARLASGNVEPVRMIWGTVSKLTRVAHGVFYDAGRDQIVGSEPLASSVVTFDAGANGQVPPLRVLQGPKTQLHQPWGVAVDDLHHELVVGDYASSNILVYPWDANGDVAPIRTIGGVKTMMRGISDITVDPKDNLIIAVTMQSRTSAASGGGVYTSHYETAETQHPGGIFIFDRTANGDVKPKGMIFGPHTGIMATAQVQVADGKIFATVSNTPYQPPYNLAGTAPRAGCTGPPLPPLTMGSGNNFVGVWNVTDNGDVPPRFIIHGPSSQMVAPAGIAVNPKAGEVYVTDGGVGSTFTFLVPQAF
jgi:hypothetical protein